MTSIAIAHIGLMKAGSTTLQQFISEDHRIASYVHRPEFYHTFKGDTKALSERIRSTDRPVFISDENLSRTYHKIRSFESSLEHIQRICGRVLVLWIVREQRSFLVSAYKHHIRQTSDTSSFEEWIGTRAGQSQLELCYFSDLLLRTRSVLGEGLRMELLFFEDLVSQPEAWIEQIYQMIGLSVPNRKTVSKMNASISPKGFALKLKWNRLKSSKYLKRLPGVFLDNAIIWRLLSALTRSYEAQWSDLSFEQRSALEERFRMANRALIAHHPNLPKDYLV